MNIELPKPSPGAALVIRMIDLMSDHERSADVSTAMCLHQHHALNDAQLGVATHIMARVLIVHSTLHSAAAFLAENTATPLPDAFRAVLDLALNLPVDFDTKAIRT
jgi:hypothetical protein